MNLCVTLNPCLDKTLVVPPWTPGEHQVRGRSFSQVVGGKGVNVARALRRLSHPAQPALFLGGELGQLCHRLLREQDGFEPLVTWTQSPTREILTLRTEDTANQTAFFDPNPTILPGERDEFAAKLVAAFAAGVTWCVMSGSSPCRATDDLYATLVRQARKKGVSTLVDTYGDCFGMALAAVPDVVKLNRQECEQALGMQLDSPQSMREALQRIRDTGVRYVAVTCGPLGMAAAWDQHVTAWKPPAIELVNPIGAGDAMTAGLVDALSRGDEPSRSFRWAMACAVASVEHWVACDFQRCEAEAMLPRIVECPLAELAVRTNP
ncbi:MAG: 1-phosphofructokinase family hexose kinase [Pirellulaceae bacterium]